MGTRSLTHVHDEDGEVLVTIYRQYDGYPEGLGVELADFLTDRVVVNGYGVDVGTKTSNGMGCLAASLVAHLKVEIGNVYIVAPASSDHFEEYTYRISLTRETPPRLNLFCARAGWESEGETIYDGPPEDFPPACVKSSESEK
jgi:hypothetical protein